MKRILIFTIGLFFASLAQGQSKELPKISASDSSFVQERVDREKPLSYSVTPTNHGILLVLVFEDFTFVEMLVDGFAVDLVEFAPEKAIVYPREERE